MKKGRLFELIKFNAPVIANYVELLSDNNKGGILLVYKVTDVKYISFFNHNYSILFKRSEQLVFFRPLKRNWPRNVYKITLFYWGKKHHLLTKLWLEVDTDFKDIFSVTPAKLKRISHLTFKKDKELIKQLNSRNEKFILSNNQNR